MRRCSTHCHCVLQTCGAGSREPISVPLRQTMVWFSAELGPVGELAGTIGRQGGELVVVVVVAVARFVVLASCAPATAGIASTAARMRTADFFMFPPSLRSGRIMTPHSPRRHTGCVQNRVTMLRLRPVNADRGQGAQNPGFRMNRE